MKYWKQLEFNFKLSITQQFEEVDWEFYEKNIDSSNSKWIVYMLTAVHAISIIAFEMMKFNDDYISKQDWENFLPKFIKLSAFLLVINISTCIVIKVHLNKVAADPES